MIIESELDIDYMWLNEFDCLLPFNLNAEMPIMTNNKDKKDRKMNMEKSGMSWIVMLREHFNKMKQELGGVEATQYNV